MSSVFVLDGMKRPAFTVKIDVESSTVADLFREVARSYELKLDPIKDLRIIFVDKELRYRKKTKLRDVGIINVSTIGVIFRLPDKHPKAPSAKEDDDDVDSVEAEITDENKDAVEVSITKSEQVKIDDEREDAEAVPVAESIPVRAIKKTKKKKKKDAKVLPLLKDAFESLTVTTDRENKEAGDILAPASELAKVKKKRKRNKRKTGKACAVEMEEKRPVLENLPEILALTFDPDFLDFDMTQRRARLPCYHVMGSETMRFYCQDLIDTGNTTFTCPYTLFPLLPGKCPAVWEYRHVRHVACFTTTEMRNTEKTIAINFVGKDSITLTCPGCFTWCSKVDSKQTRMRCFICTREIGKEFLFCGYCLREWKNARCGKCANPECKSIDATLDILRNCPKDLDSYGREWPTIRLCPRCGILTKFIDGCAQIHCELCLYYYCFLCLKGAKYKAQLKCAPYDSTCQIASVQTSIPEWDGRNSD